jgi:hypothetical protein
MLPNFDCAYQLRALPCTRASEPAPSTFTIRSDRDGDFGCSEEKRQEIVGHEEIRGSAIDPPFRK